MSTYNLNGKIWRHYIETGHVFCSGMPATIAALQSALHSARIAAQFGGVIA